MDHLEEESESLQLYLEQAIADGDVAAVRKLVTRSSYDLNSGDGRVNATALFLLSVQGGNIDIIESALQLRPPPNVQFIDDKGRLLLHFAAETGSLSVVKTLLSLDDPVENVHVNMSDVDGRTPIMIAASKGYADIVDFFIQKGGRLNEARLIATGDSILHLAAQEGHLGVVEVLIKHGADVNCRTPPQCMRKGGMTVLHSAVLGGNIEVVKLLCTNGADQSRRDAFRRCAFHTAAHKGNIDMIRTFIDIGADLEMKDGNSMTPLAQAVLGQAEEVVAYLLKCGADVVAVDESGYQSIHLAAAADSVDILQMLIEHGADVDAKTVLESTPLMEACFAGSPSVVEHLIAHGADVDAKTFFLESTPLMEACSAGSPSVVEHLIAHGADVNKVDWHGCTALHKAQICDEGGQMITEELSLQLIAAGAKISVRNKCRETPLHCLVDNCCLNFKEAVSAIKILVRHGAELIPDASQPSCDEFLTNALLSLVLDGFYESARFLVLAGWDVRKEKWLDLRQENWLDFWQDQWKDDWMYVFREANWLNGQGDSPEHNDFMAWLRSQITEPKSLAWLCRHSIRRTLIQVSDGKEILSKVAQLPVPHTVISFLNLDDI